MIRIVKLGMEHRRKVGVSEVRRVVLLHKIDDTWVFLIYPHIPEPCRAKAGHEEDAPMKKDADLGLIVPGEQRARVQRVPGGLVLTSDLGDTCQGKRQGAD